MKTMRVGKLFLFYSWLKSNRKSATDIGWSHIVGGHLPHALCSSSPQPGKRQKLTGTNVFTVSFNAVITWPSRDHFQPTFGLVNRDFFLRYFLNIDGNFRE